MGASLPSALRTLARLAALSAERPNPAPRGSSPSRKHDDSDPLGSTRQLSRATPEFQWVDGNSNRGLWRQTRAGTA